jgi:hypothetical protein
MVAGVILVMAYGLTLSGFIFQVVLVVCALAVVSFALRWEMGRAIPFVCTGVLAMLVWGKIQRAPYHDYVARTIQEEGETGLVWRINGPSRVLEVLKANWKSDGIPVVWCANYGWVDGNTISWEAAKGGLPWKVYNLGTIFGTQRNTSSGLELPEYADYIVVPSPGITGEIVTPYAIHDWNATAQASGHWNILAKIQAPSGEIVIYKNNLPFEARDFKMANTWLKRKKS